MIMIIMIIISKFLNFRRRKMKNHFYIPSSQSQRDDLPLWDLESLDNESGKTPVPANIFPQVSIYCITPTNGQMYGKLTFTDNVF